MRPVNTSPSARASDPSTSHAAAGSMRSPATGLRAELLAAYRAASGGLTMEEAAEAAGIPTWAASKRISELRAAGLIRDTGATRPGASGREQMVCVAVVDDVPSSLFPTPKGGFRW